MVKKFASQADLEVKKVSFTKLAENAYAYTAEGDPNTGVIIGDDGVMVLDTQATPTMAKDVIASIDLALDRGAHVAINYLNCPGFTDTPEEVEALTTFLAKHPIQMIQWRNLNFDPRHYIQLMNKVADHSPPMGIDMLLKQLRQHFPKIRFGYFNPPKEKF